MTNKNLPAFQNLPKPPNQNKHICQATPRVGPQRRRPVVCPRRRAVFAAAPARAVHVRFPRSVYVCLLSCAAPSAPAMAGSCCAASPRRPRRGVPRPRRLSSCVCGGPPPAATQKGSWGLRSATGLRQGGGRVPDFVCLFLPRARTCHVPLRRSPKSLAPLAPLHCVLPCDSRVDL